MEKGYNHQYKEFQKSLFMQSKLIEKEAMVHTDDTKQKMRQKHLGTHHSAETKQRIRAAMLRSWEDRKLTIIELGLMNAAIVEAGGEPLPLPEPRRHSEATKAKIRASAKGRKFSAKALTALAEKRANLREEKAELEALYRECILFKPKNQKQRKQPVQERRWLEERVKEKEQQELAEKLRIRLFKSKGDQNV